MTHTHTTHTYNKTHALFYIRVLKLNIFIYYNNNINKKQSLNKVIYLI